MAIKRAFKTEKEYREYPALNFSKLAAFWHDGLYSPDHALMTTEYKSYFEYGKQFESSLQDTVKGTKDFNERYFVSGVKGNVPDYLLKWIEDEEDLESKIVYNQNGKRNKSKKVMHAYIDECLNNPGLIPVFIEDAEMIKAHVGRMIDMEFYGKKVGDLLEKGEWQVGIKWICEHDSLEKKALIDCIVDLGGFYLVIDIKTAANFTKFKWMLQSKYVFQDLHYVEGVEQKIGEAKQMVFFVASKEKPFLCQPWSVDYGDNFHLRQHAYSEYQDLCSRYTMWDGKERGWLPLQTMQLHPSMKYNL